MGEIKKKKNYKDIKDVLELCITFLFLLSFQKENSAYGPLIFLKIAVTY